MARSDRSPSRSAADAGAGASRNPASSRVVGGSGEDDWLHELAALTHKINNPLTTLLGRTQLLARRLEREGHEAAAAVASMEDSARRIADLVRRLGGLLKQRRALAAQEAGAGETGGT